MVYGERADAAEYRDNKRITKGALQPEIGVREGHDEEMRESKWREERESVWERDRVCVGEGEKGEEGEKCLWSAAVEWERVCVNGEEREREKMCLCWANINFG